MRESQNLDRTILMYTAMLSSVSLFYCQGNTASRPSRDFKVLQQITFLTFTAMISWNFNLTNIQLYRQKSLFQSPSGLSPRSAAACLLEFWVRIPPEAWMFVVSVVDCQVEVSEAGW